MGNTIPSSPRILLVAVPEILLSRTAALQLNWI